MVTFSRANINDDTHFEAGQQSRDLKVGQVLSSNVTELTPKYLIYEVNPGEGFNLRRDVYIRVANLVKHLRNLKENWMLVLPPWRRLYHWRSNIEQNAVPWKTFFDIESMSKYVPVIEFDDFVHQTGSSGMDEIIYLQRHPDGFKNGWEEKIEEAKCTDSPVYRKGEDGNYHGYFWGQENVFGRKFRCVSVQGTSAILANFLRKLNTRLVLNFSNIYLKGT